LLMKISRKNDREYLHMPFSLHSGWCPTEMKNMTISILIVAGDSCWMLLYDNGYFHMTICVTRGPPTPKARLMI
jgi:hypothetical protein